MQGILNYPSKVNKTVPDIQWERIWTDKFVYCPNMHSLSGKILD